MGKESLFQASPKTPTDSNSPDSFETVSSIISPSTLNQIQSSTRPKKVQSSAEYPRGGKCHVRGSPFSLRGTRSASKSPQRRTSLSGTVENPQTHDLFLSPLFRAMSLSLSLSFLLLVVLERNETSEMSVQGTGSDPSERTRAGNRSNGKTGRAERRKIEQPTPASLGTLRSNDTHTPDALPRPHPSIPCRETRADWPRAPPITALRSTALPVGVASRPLPAPPQPSLTLLVSHSQVVCVRSPPSRYANALFNIVFSRRCPRR